MLRIGFLSFWDGGDIELFKERSFFSPLREYGIQFEECDPYKTECHIVFISVFGVPNMGRLKGNPILISFRGEPAFWFSNNEELCKYHIGFKPDSEYDLYYPLFVLYLGDLLKYRDRQFLLSDKTSFCSFIVTNPRCSRRNELFTYISDNYKKVDSLGSYKNNCGFILPRRDFVYPKKYKFNICFENSPSGDDYVYITEKIIWAYTYNSVPLYWGNSNICEYFDSDSFINCNGLSNEEILDKVKSLDADDEKYLRMINVDIHSIAEGYILEYKKKFIDFIRRVCDDKVTI